MTELLERRYRSLLRCYPRAWREARTEEIVAVLLEAAPADRTRPTLRDTADLVRCGLGERLRVTRSDPAWAAGAALAGLIALILLVAFSVLQLFTLLPDPGTWYAGETVKLALISSIAEVLAGACWCARRRRLALAAIAVADVTLVWAAFAARGSVAPWTTLAGLVGLAAVATGMLASRRVEAAGRQLLGPLGGAAAVAMLLVAADRSGWTYAGWHWFMYGGPQNALLYAMPRAFVLAFGAGVFVAVLLAPRTAVPLIACAVLSPVLLAGVTAEVVRREVAGNVTASVDVTALLTGIAAVAALSLAALAATRLRARRSRA